MEYNHTSAIRTRFAPSPTGSLHIGGVRTAIFCYLFARHHKGQFLLRIEDTDQERSKPGYVQEILNGLQWIGLDWDGESYIQSQHQTEHIRAALQIREMGKAYFCYCDPASLEEKRRKADQSVITYKYDRHCLTLSESERADLESRKQSKTLRFLVPDGETIFEDMVHGKIQVDHREIDDFILLRSDGTPTYQMAVISDDHAMGITHVVRGDDHLSNTPKQILLYHALGYPVPVFAHIPLIFGTNKKKLSKRHGAVSLGEYHSKGYLAEALFNFLALLGWAPEGNRELFTKQELIDRFDLSAVAKKNAIFDEKKLEWLNGQYISRAFDENLIPAVSELFVKYGIFGKDEISQHSSKIQKIIELLKSRVKILPEFVTYGGYYFRDPSTFDESAKTKYWSPEAMKHLLTLADSLEKLESFNQQTTEECLRSLADKHTIKASAVIHPVRLALTGFGVSPGLFEVMEELGKPTVIRRLRKAVEYFEQFKN